MFLSATFLLLSFLLNLKTKNVITMTKSSQIFDKAAVFFVIFLHFYNVFYLLFLLSSATTMSQQANQNSSPVRDNT